MDPEKKLFRFVLLIFNCFMTFGSYFCMDMTSVLQNEMQGTVNCTAENHTVKPITDGANITCCEDCLYISPDEFNLLYSARAWTVATVVPFIGLFIDKLGNKVGAITMSTIVVIGNGLFAFGSSEVVRHTPYMLPILFAGRLLLGISEASVRIVQDRITAFWFREKELSTAFGITLTTSRLGSVLNFFVSPNIAHRFGLTWAFAFGVVLCLVSFGASIIVTALDSYGVKKAGRHEQVQKGHKEMRCRDITKFTAEFWLIITAIMFFYSGFVPLVGNGSKYIHDMYGIDERTAAYIMGAIFDISIPFSPIIGYLVDRFGGRFLYLMFVGVAVLPAYILLDFTLIHPLIITVYLGFCYVGAAIGMWPCMPLVTDSKNMGLALGLTVAFQGFGVGATNAVVGHILGDHNSITETELHHRWRLFLIPLCVSTLLASVTGSAAVLLDSRRGKRLMKSSDKSKEMQEVSGEGNDTASRRESDSSSDERKPLISKDKANIN